MKIMAIMNINDNSFYSGSRFLDLKNSLKYIEENYEYFDILDLGAESTRPGSLEISSEKEQEFLLPLIKEIKKNFKDIKISIDTYKSDTAKKVLDLGVNMINDIKSLEEEKMAKIISEYDAQVVLMHRKGSSFDMQKNPYYDDVVREVYEFLKQRKEYAINQGIKDERIIVDPGIGFGKNMNHNIDLIKNLEVLNSLGPVLLAASRKTIISDILKGIDVKDRLTGSLALVVKAYYAKSYMVRVHDIKESYQMIRMLEAL